MNVVTGPFEVELKLECEASAWPSPAELAAALGEQVIAQWQGQVSVADLYLDTPSFRLLRHGFTCRIRHQDDQRLLTLKSLRLSGYEDDVLRRFEIEVGLPAETDPCQPQEWPEPARQSLPAAYDKAPLVPYLVIHQSRESYLVGETPGPGCTAADGSDAKIASLSLDQVAAHGFGPQRLAQLGRAESNRLAALAEPWPALRQRIIELEQLAEGKDPRFDLLVARLKEQLRCRVLGQSKLELALAALASRPVGFRGPESGIQPSMLMAEAGRLMWRKQLLSMILTEAGARRGEDIEYVHDMRVATRRARSVAALFGGYFRARAIRPFRRALRRTAELLGAVRDLDVALFKLRKYCKTRPETELPALEAIADVWRQQRKAAYGELIAWLNSPDYDRFIAEFDEFCRTPGAGMRRQRQRNGPPSRCKVAHVMPSAILDRFEQIRAYDQILEEPAASPPLSQLHALRIDCKRLRYSLEPVLHLLGPEGEELVAELKKLQDLLGDLNDAFVARERLRVLGTASPALEAYISFQESILTELAAKVPVAWQDFVSPANRERLARAIARL